MHVAVHSVYMADMVKVVGCQGFWKYGCLVGGKGFPHLL